MTPLRALGALALVGTAWGLTVPLAKIAAEGGQPIGLLAWETTVTVALLAAFLAATGRRAPPLRPHLPLFAMVGLCGTLLPGITYYTAAVHLPGGVMSMLVALVPMIAWPMAILARLEPPRLGRAAGLLLGAAAVVLLTRPESLPDAAALPFLLLALLAPVLYAAEGTYVGARGTSGLAPPQVLLGATALMWPLAWALAIGTGQVILPWDASGRVGLILAIATLHAGAYTGYVALIGRAGPVFTAQVSYLVTGTGVLWSMALLRESYPPTIWAALLLLLGGLALVQPRPAAPTPQPRHTGL